MISNSVNRKTTIMIRITVMNEQDLFCIWFDLVQLHEVTVSRTTRSWSQMAAGLYAAKYVLYMAFSGGVLTLPPRIPELIGTAPYIFGI